MEPHRRPAAGPPRGILRTTAAPGGVEHRRVLPCAPLAGSVAHLWWVRWDLAAPTRAETLPHPCAHVLFEQDARGRMRAEVAGVATGRFERELAGRGRVFAVKFRPAAFQPLLRAPMASLTDRVVPIEAVFGDAGRALARAVARAPDLERCIALAEAFFVSRVSALPARVARLRDLVERVAADRTLVRVEDVAALADTDARALQRAFRRYVGATPKWVLQRYRLHEAAERLKGPSPPALAALAAELGYSDQAHFARDFKAAIGRSPRRFAAMERGNT